MKAEMTYSVAQNLIVAVSEKERWSFGMTKLFAIRKEGKVTIIELLAELDRLSVLVIKNQLTVLVKRGQKNFIINFSKIDSVSSAIVAAWVGMRNLVREHGGVNPYGTFELNLSQRLPNLEEKTDDNF